MSLINLITVSKSTILGRISPVQIFAYHSPKLWTNWFVHVNGKNPMYIQQVHSFRLGF